VSDDLGFNITVIAPPPPRHYPPGAAKSHCGNQPDLEGCVPSYVLAGSRGAVIDCGASATSVPTAHDSGGERGLYLTGAVRFYGRGFEIRNCRARDGAAVYFDRTAWSDPTGATSTGLFLEVVTLTDNKASNDGGAVWVSREASFAHVTATGSYAGGNGGALFLEAPQAATRPYELMASVLAGGEAIFGNGGLVHGAGELTVGGGVTGAS
jgi:hypothetical protein